MSIGDAKQLDRGSPSPRAAPKLDRDMERELARRACAGDSSAEQTLVSSLQGFVVRTARAYRRSGVPMPDLVQEGMIGLIQAVRRFNPDRDVRLATYAMWWVRAAMLDHIVRSWSLVRLGTSSAQKSLFLSLRRFTALVDSADALSDDIIQRLAERFETTASDVRALARRVTHRDASLDARAANLEGTGEAWIDRIASEEPTVEDRLVAESDQKLLSDLIPLALARLPDREQFIIRNRYLSSAKRTLASIGRELNLSKDRVRQLEARALASLRDVLGAGLAQHR